MKKAPFLCHCPVCKGPVVSTAETCQQCGMRFKKKQLNATEVLAVVILALLILYGCSHL